MANDERARSRLGSFKQLADGRVRVTVSHGYTVDGRQRRLTGYADSMDEAERVALGLAAELGRRPDLAAGLTLSWWWEVYSRGKGARLARSTYERYRGDMERTWLPRLGGTDVSMVSRRDVQDVLLGMGTRSNATHALRTLSAVLSQAVADGYLGENPLRAGGFELPGDVGAGVPDIGEGDDPFAAIEGAGDVWDARTVLAALPLIEGAPIETCWLAMVGAGLRLEEALALTWRDVRRIEVGGRYVTQIAVYKARTEADGEKRTKTRRSVRIAAMAEPFGSRLWSLRGEPVERVVTLSPGNIRHRWRGMFQPVTSKHAKRAGRWKGRLVGLPYVPLSRMRATHETFLQQAGVLDSVNAAAHGHSQRVSYTNYQRPDVSAAAIKAGDFLLIEGGASESAVYGKFGVAKAS